MQCTTLSGDVLQVMYPFMLPCGRSIAAAFILNQEKNRKFTSPNACRCWLLSSSGVFSSALQHAVWRSPPFFRQWQLQTILYGLGGAGADRSGEQSSGKNRTPHHRPGKATLVFVFEECDESGLISFQILELELWHPKGLVGSPEMEGRIFERMSFLGSFLGISLFADDDVSGTGGEHSRIEKENKFYRFV